MIILKDQKTRRRIRPRGIPCNVWEPIVPGSRSPVPVDERTEILTYEVALDMHQIGVMAIKAGANRNGRSKSGPVIVQITGRVKDEVKDTA
jgi:hypothetical protein